MDFGLGFDKLVVIAVMAAFFIGPSRLPVYAAGFARFVQGARTLIAETKARMRDELGPEFDDVEWTKLDPRQYDPRRIIRDAFLEEPTPGPSELTAHPDRNGEDAVPAQKGSD